MENVNNRKREREEGELLLNCIEKDFLNREKENELKLFENIKTDISVIISEQLKKRSKAESEFTSTEKKIVYLKTLSEEIEKLLKKQGKDLQQEKEVVTNYLEYTSTNLDYIFLKYESIIQDLTQTNNDMKGKIKKIKENELTIFETTYKELREKLEILYKMKNNIVCIREFIVKLKEEEKNVKKQLQIKTEEATCIEVEYDKCVKKKENCINEFIQIKEICNKQMEIKKKSTEDLIKIEEKIKEANCTIQNMVNEKIQVTEKVNETILKHEEILNKLIFENEKWKKQYESIKKEIEIGKKEIEDLIIRKEKITNEYNTLEIKLKNCTTLCDIKKREDENITKIIKEKSKILAEKKIVLKEKEKECTDVQTEENLKKKKMEKIKKMYTDIEEQLKLKIEENGIVKKEIEKQKNELIELEQMKKNEEKMKIEILNTIKNLETNLEEEKNVFFTISKILNSINLSSEIYNQIKKDRESDPIKNVENCTKIFDELNETYNQLKNELNEKELIYKKTEDEITIFEFNLKNFETEIQSLLNEKKESEENLRIIEETKKNMLKEIKEKEETAEQQVEEVEKTLKEKLNLLQEELQNEFRAKQMEHYNYLKQAETEKYECEFNMFKTECLSRYNSQKEEKKNRLIQLDEELKGYQQRYTKLKAI